MAVTRGQSSSFAASCIARSVSDRVIADFNSLFVFFEPFIVSIALAVFNNVAPHPEINDVRCWTNIHSLKRNSTSNSCSKDHMLLSKFRCLRSRSINPSKAHTKSDCNTLIYYIQNQGYKITTQNSLTGCHATVTQTILNMWGI